MFDPATLFFEAATKAAAGHLAKKTIDGLWESVASGFKAPFPDDSEGIERARLDPSSKGASWNKLRAQFRFVDRKGVLFLGPSGAGKSQLIEKLTGKRSPTGPTSSHRPVVTRLGAQFVAMRDTVGDKTQQGHFRSTLGQMDNGASVIVLTFAYGYLDTQPVGKPEDSVLKRPGRADPYGSLSKYLTGCRQEERNWLQQLLAQFEPLPEKLRANALVIVVNKRDQWADNPRVRSRYLGSGRMSELIDEFNRVFIKTQWRGDESYRESYFPNYYVETCASHCRFRHVIDPKNEGIPSSSITGHDATLSVNALRAGLESLLENSQ